MIDIPLDALVGFVAACLIMESTPGPNMAFLAIVSAGEGRKYGFATVAGITLGLTLLGIVAAAGMANVISRSALLYELLRWAGVAYLLWLAYEGWREAGESSLSRKADKQPLRTYFRHGFIVNMLNPKAAAFYVTVLPGFLPRTDAVLSEAIALTLISVMIATLVHILIVAMASSLQGLLISPERNKRARRLMSVLLAGVAIWLGWSTSR